MPIKTTNVFGSTLLFLGACKSVFASPHKDQYSFLFSEPIEVFFDSASIQSFSYQKFIQKNPISVVHAVRVEKTLAIKFLTTTNEKESRLTVSDFAEENDCELALNASFFELQNTGTSLFEYSTSESYELKKSKIINYFTWGPTIANGSAWKKSKLFPIFPDFVGYFSLDYSGNFSISKYEPSFQKNPYLMISGLPILITNGQAVHLVNAPKAREPRTAVGLTQNNELLFVIIDGRNSGVSEGVDLSELQKIMLALGAKEALNLDGGGSSTLYIRSLGGIVNRPSEDGIQRVVANHLCLCTKAEGSKHD